MRFNKFVISMKYTSDVLFYDLNVHAITRAHKRARERKAMHRTIGKAGLAIAGAAAAAMVLSACGGGDSAGADLDPDADLSQQSLTVSNWAGYYPEDLGAQFQAAVGTPMTITNHATNEEIMAKLTAGGDSGIDVAFVSGQFAQALNEAGLIEPINPEFVPNMANLYPEAKELAYDPGNAYSVPYAWGTTGICYRSDLVDEPTSWNDILEPSAENDGKITALATERWLMLPAQKALGFSANTTDEGEMEQVKEKLIAAKPGLLAYDDTTFYSRLVSGEATMVVAWDGWCNYGTAENPDIKFVVPSEGSDLWADTMVVLKTSENKEAAHAFINYILDPVNHAWVAENILYKVPNAPAMEAVAGLAADFPNMGYTPAELLKQEGLIDLGEAGPMYTEIATEVTSS
ncbi:MAG: spermidine/putrescine ABC transporter substrate-binding protein [Actinomycetota bacterium]|nr:spermidine/putrescine ABC transporter substrate-binding protein [Actinomycetota bacterium]